MVTDLVPLGTLVRSWHLHFVDVADRLLLQHYYTRKPWSFPVWNIDKIHPCSSSVKGARHRGVLQKESWPVPIWLPQREDSSDPMDLPAGTTSVINAFPGPPKRDLSNREQFDNWHHCTVPKLRILQWLRPREHDVIVRSVLEVGLPSTVVLVRSCPLKATSEQTVFEKFEAQLIVFDFTVNIITYQSRRQSMNCRQWNEYII